MYLKFDNIKECSVNIERLSRSPTATPTSSPTSSHAASPALPRCTVNIRQFYSFPESGGAYPHQATKLKTDFFPGINNINSADIKKNRMKVKNLRSFSMTW